MQYLILHKVRGEPAFDIAEQIQIGDEEGWIIPTSGHRAYPYWWYGPVKAESTTEGLMVNIDMCERIPDMPVDLPDHYQISRHEPKQTLDIGSLLSGLMPRGKFKRRA